MRNSISKVQLVGLVHIKKSRELCFFFFWDAHEAMTDGANPIIHF
jgi:hypothetical protein